MLTQRALVPYLLERGLVGVESIVESDLVVMDASRRNSNVKVISERGPCYLLKQGIGPEGITTVAHEAAVYQQLTAARGHDKLAPYLPRCYGYDPQERILVLELSRDAQSLHEYHMRRGRFPVLFAAALGRALAALHRLDRSGIAVDQHNSWFTGQPPWVLSLYRPSLATLRDVSNANTQLIKIMQQFPAFCDLLNGLRQGWRADALIHGDIKWDNCIVVPGSASGRQADLKIVDWELAGPGDPCWDVGAVFAGYLSFWLLSIPITGEAPPDRFMELARFPLARMQPAMRLFWQSYVQHMRLDAATAAEWLLRAIQYSAARLLLTAFEQMQLALRLTGNVVCLAQVSLNIMMRPHDAGVQLLGLPVARLETS